MSDFINAFLLVYAALFPIINPVGSAPIFLGLTRQVPVTGRNQLARSVAINSVFVLLGSMFVGSHLLGFFGITLPVVRIAGGLVLISFGWQLLYAGTDIEDKRSASDEAKSGAIDSFYPLTMPLTAGPGSISVAIALGSQRPAGSVLSEWALQGAAAVAGVLAIALTIYVCYRYAERTISLLGKHGTNIMVRLSAFILLCIGIQILWNGYSALAITLR